MPLETELILVFVDVELELDRRHDVIRAGLARHFPGLERPREMTDRLAIAGEIELHGAHIRAFCAKDRPSIIADPTPSARSMAWE